MVGLVAMNLLRIRSLLQIWWVVYFSVEKGELVSTVWFASFQFKFRYFTLLAHQHLLQFCDRMQHLCIGGWRHLVVKRWKLLLRHRHHVLIVIWMTLSLVVLVIIVWISLLLSVESIHIHWLHRMHLLLRVAKMALWWLMQYRNLRHWRLQFTSFKALNFRTFVYLFVLPQQRVFLGKFFVTFSLLDFNDFFVHVCLKLNWINLTFPLLLYKLYVLYKFF